MPRQGVHDGHACFALLQHNKEADAVQLANHRPVVAVRRHKDDRIHAGGIHFAACPHRQRHIALRFVLVQPLDLNMFQLKVRFFIHRRRERAVNQRFPLCRCILAVKQNHLGYFAQLLGREAAQRRRELHGIRIFAVHRNQAFFALPQQPAQIAHRVVARIAHQRQVFKAVFVALIENRYEFFIIIEDIALALRACGNSIPVNPAVERVAAGIAFIVFPCFFDTIFFRPVRHQENGFHIVPLHPFREKARHLIDSVADFTIDADNVFVNIRLCFVNSDAVLFQLRHRF